MYPIMIIYNNFFAVNPITNHFFQRSADYELKFSSGARKA